MEGMEGMTFKDKLEFSLMGKSYEEKMAFLEGVALGIEQTHDASIHILDGINTKDKGVNT